MLNACSYPEFPVYFLDASTEDRLKTDLETAIRSRGPTYHSRSYEDALIWLANEGRDWLVILDNADDPNVPLSQFIPKSRSGNVIITTRNATYAALAPNSYHALEGLSVPDSVTLLLNMSKYPITDANWLSAEQVVTELQCLPLAVAHAGGYIFVHQCLTMYLDTYRKHKAKFLAATRPEQLSDYRLSVAMTIQMSLERLPQELRYMMHLFSYLRSSSIPYSIIARAAERHFRHVGETEESSFSQETLGCASALMKIFCMGGEWSEFEFNELILQSLQYSLLHLTTQGDDKFYSMHVLVRSHLQAYTSQIHGCSPRQLVVRLLGSAVTISENYEFLSLNRQLLPHVQLVRLEDIVEAGDHRSFAHVLSETGGRQLGVYHMERCVEIRRRLLGEENKLTVITMGELSFYYAYSGRNQEALDLQERVLEMQKNVLGPEDPITVLSMARLAIIYANLRRDEAALKLEEEVLSISMRLLGPEHLDTARAMDNLGTSYQSMGRTREAVLLQEKSFSLWKQILRPEHPKTLLTMGNLANSYRDLKRYQEAVELDEKVLASRKQFLGAEHPSTLLAMNNLAVSYSWVGRGQDQLDISKEVLALRRQLLGPEHPDTLNSMLNLALTYKHLGRHQEAVELGSQVLSLYRQLLGLEHPDTLRAMRDLAGFYADTGRNEDALALGEEALMMKIRHLGLQHPDTLAMMWDLSTIYEELDMQDKYLKLLKIAVPAYEAAESYGKGHPDTVLLQEELTELSAELENRRRLRPRRHKVRGSGHSVFMGRPRTAWVTQT